MAGNWIGAYHLFRREVTRFTKILVDTTVSPIVSNLLYLIIFSVAFTGRKVMGVEYVQFLASGLIPMTLINSSFSNPSFALVIAKFAGTINDLLISPLTGAQIALSYIGAAMVRALFTGLLTFIVILFFTHLSIHSIPLLILAALLTSAFFGTLGVVFGYFAKQFDSLTMISTFVMTPMSFLGGVFFNVALLGEPWRSISYINPMLYFIDLIRFSILGVSYIDPILSLSVAIISNIILLPFAIYLFNQRKGLII
ncbi:MAG: ABC transporter permease [Candidatus Sericytochromatia bacterium]